MASIDSPEPKAPVEGATLASSTVRMRVTYAEVDRMGFLHHSNHLRWFERGREEFCRRRSIGYREMEDAGTLVVVVDAEVHYRSPLRYEDLADLTIHLAEVRHATLAFEYELRRVSDGVLAASGRTRHAFVTREGRLVRGAAPLMKLLTAPESHEGPGEIG